jgi:hypothetical protein
MNKVEVLKRLDDEIEMLQDMLDDGVFHSSYSVSDVLDRTIKSREWFIKQYDL